MQNMVWRLERLNKNARQLNNRDRLKRLGTKCLAAAARASPQPRTSNSSQPEVVVGIDLGTTNSAVAYIVNGRPDCIPNDEGFRTTPSVVSILDDGEVVVGRLAKRQAASHPCTTYHSVKRLIGRSFAEVESNTKGLAYKVRADDEGTAVLDCPNVEPGILYPEEVSAQVIAQLLADVVKQTNCRPVSKAVISVPAYFKEGQVQATVAAGKLAGLEKVRIIREPVAAALAYGLDLQQDQTVLVFDLGGGTFDISILEVGKGVVEVLATGGDPQLGGDDWDACIVQWLVKAHLKPNGVDCSDPRLIANLRSLAEFAKIRLSDAKEVLLRLPVGGPRGAPLEVVLTRQHFEKITAELFQRCRAPLDTACWQAGVDLVGLMDSAAQSKGGKLQPRIRPKRREPLSKVLLVGGSTRMPAVRRFIRNMTGIDPFTADVDPDEAVALGAGVQAGMLQGDVEDLMVMDVWQSALMRAFAKEKMKEDREEARRLVQGSGAAVGEETQDEEEGEEEEGEGEREQEGRQRTAAAGRGPSTAAGPSRAAQEHTGPSGTDAPRSASHPGSTEDADAAQAVVVSQRPKVRARPARRLRTR